MYKVKRFSVIKKYPRTMKAALVAGELGLAAVGANMIGKQLYKNDPNYESKKKKTANAVMYGAF